MPDRQINDALPDRQQQANRRRESDEFLVDADVQNVYMHIDRRVTDNGDGTFSTDWPAGKAIMDAGIEVSFDGGATWEPKASFNPNGGVVHDRGGNPVMFASLYTWLPPERGVQRRCRCWTRTRDRFRTRAHLELAATNPLIRVPGPSKPPGSVGLDSSDSATSTTANSATTGNLTVGSGESLVVIIGGDADDSLEPTEDAATWNTGAGEDIPSWPGDDTQQSNYTIVSGYGAERPTAATDTVTGSVGGSQVVSVHVHAMVLTGVDGTTGFSDAIADSPVTSVNVTNVATGDMVIGAGGSEDTSSIVEDASQTQIQSTGPIGAYDMTLTSSRETGSGTVAHSYTFNSSNSPYHEIIAAVRVIASAAGGGIEIFRRRIEGHA